MTVTVSFAVTVALILGAGFVFRRWDESHHQRFTDEAGTARAVPALARVEARRLALHPAFLITVGFIGAVTAAFMIPEANHTIEADRVEFFTVIAVPLGALALVAGAHRNAQHLSDPKAHRASQRGHITIVGHQQRNVSDFLRSPDVNILHLALVQFLGHFEEQ